MREGPPYYIYDKKLLISGKIALRCAKKMQRCAEIAIFLLPVPVLQVIIKFRISFFYWCKQLLWINQMI